VLPDPELSVKEKLGLAGPSLPLDRSYDERFRRLQKLRHDIHKFRILTDRESHLVKRRPAIGKAFGDIGHAPKDQSNRRKRLPDYAVWELHPVMKPTAQ
jgi:hypothetical protein